MPHAGWKIALGLVTAFLAAVPSLGATNEERAQCKAKDPSIAACTLLIEGEPKESAHNLGDFYFFRGNAYRRKGDLSRAIADYDHAIELRPTVSAYINRGISNQNIGNLTQGLSDYDKALVLDPDNSSALVNRGGAYRASGDLTRAIADYDRVIALNANKDAIVVAYNNRGFARNQGGDPDRALSDYNFALSLDPTYAFSYNNRGDVYQAKGDFIRAIADFDSAIALNPFNVDTIRAKRDSAAKLLAQAERRPTAPPAEPAAATRRFAFVLGNGAYTKLPTLTNPIADARAIASKLSAKGFDVTSLSNLGRTDFLLAFDAFRAKLREGDEVVIYYAGHGVEVNGANYLVPVDVPAFSPGAKEMIQDGSVGLTSLLAQVARQSPRATVVILDACRDDPFPRDVNVASNTRSIGAPKEGLAQVAAPQGTMVMYSAGVLETALDNLGGDDRDPNGLFTRHLLKLMDEEGLEVLSMAKRLRGEVQTAAKTVKDPDTGKPHAQTPAVYDQMIGEFFFTPKKG